MYALHHQFSWLSRFAHDDEAATAVEYGLMAALIAIALIAALQATGDSLGQIFDYWSTAVIAALTL
jgi:pilus assembly protein Flp/PilA